MADFYGTFADADTYLSAHHLVLTEWAALSEDDKKNYLRSAFQVIEKQHWIGEKVDPSQETKWPRSYDNYLNTYRFKCWSPEIQRLFKSGNKALPESILKAQYELTANIIATGQFNTLTTMKSLGIPLTSLGELGFGSEYSEQEYPLPKPVWELAKCWHLSYWSKQRIKQVISGLDVGPQRGY